MSKRIYKYPLEVTDFQEVKMPIGAQILCVQVQNETPCIWALVDEEAEPHNRKIRIYGTGHTVERNPGTYLGTFQLKGGLLVFHVFEIINP